MLADFMCTGLNITFGLLLLALGTLALEIIWKTVRKGNTALRTAATRFKIAEKNKKTPPDENQNSHRGR